MTLPGQLYREFGRPRSSQGYWHMGGVTLPQRAEQLVLTDRTDGTKWLLGVSPGGALQLTQPPLPLPTDTLLYLPGEEPITGGNRVFVQSGQLKAEPGPRGVSTQPIILNVPGDLTKLGVVSVVAGAPTLNIIGRP
jgi:hypothetical protein